VRWTQGDIAIVVIVRHEVAVHCQPSLIFSYPISLRLEIKNESYLPPGAFSCCDGWIQEREVWCVCVPVAFQRDKHSLLLAAIAKSSDRFDSSKIKRSISNLSNRALLNSHSATTNSTTDIYDPRSQIGPTTTVAATRPRFAFLLLADISFFLRNRGDGNSLSESIDIRRSLSQSTLS
jgi:hypothetical protein